MLHTHWELEQAMTDAKDLKRAEERAEELADERDELKEQVADLDSNLEELKREMRDLHEERDDLEAEVTTLAENDRETKVLLSLEREIRKGYSTIEIEVRSFDGKEIGYLLDMLDVIRVSRG